MKVRRNERIIDPSWNLTDIIETLKKNSWKADYVINTHTHFHHVLGNEEIAAITGAKIVQHKDSTSNLDLAVSDGDTIGLGKDPSNNIAYARTFCR